MMDPPPLGTWRLFLLFSSILLSCYGCYGFDSRERGLLLPYARLTVLPQLLRDIFFLARLPKWLGHDSEGIEP